MKRFLAFILAALGLNIACSQNFENTDVKGFAELIDSADVVILDVRTTDEFNEGHIKGAILIDQNKSDFLELVRQLLPKEKTIAIYCRSGRRSANAAERLVKEGYKPVNLKGGIQEWKKENMPVTKE
jgi:rhodanese-related sulfurtransferase